MERHTAFYLDPSTPLLRAMVQAEGGEEAFVRAVQCSIPKTKDLAEALARACKTIRGRVLAFPLMVVDWQCAGCKHVHQGRRPEKCEACGAAVFKEQTVPMFEFVRLEATDPWTGEPRPRRIRFTDRFIAFLGAQWAPRGVANDPTDLNANWVPNIQQIYAREVMRA